MKNTTIIGLSLLGLLAAAKPASGLMMTLGGECQLNSPGDVCVEVLEFCKDSSTDDFVDKVTLYQTLDSDTYQVRVLPENTPESLVETLNQHLYLRGDVRVSPAELLAQNGLEDYNKVCTPEEEILGLSPSLAYWTTTLEHTIQKEPKGHNLGTKI